MSSKTDIFDRVSPNKVSETRSDIFDRVSPEQISKTRSVLSSPVKGLIKGSEELGQLHDPISALAQQFSSQQNSPFEQVLDKVLPTRDETTEQVLERAGKIAPFAALGGASAPAALLQSVSGGALGQLAKEEGIGELGQAGAEAVGMGIPSLVKAGSKAAANLFKSPLKKLPSGLTEPRAVGSKLAEHAVVTPGKQEKSLKKLNKEAAQLTKSVVHKELPLSKQMEKGFDFEGNFEKRFGDLQRLAERSNPEIDLTPMSQFLSDSGKKYRGIPKLHADAAKVVSEISAFRNSPQTEMKKLLRIYRSNNNKIRNIYETSRLTGKQQEYVDFLVDYNRNIAKSFEKTLPKDSPWIKEFRGLNQEYKQYKDSLKTINILDDVLAEKATASTIQKLADDPKLQKKLSLSLGEKGSAEVAQIAKDLRTATDSLKRMSVRDLKWYDSLLPFGLFIPGVKIPTGVVIGKKAYDYAKRGYGWFLSTPKRRAVYNDLLKGIAEDNRSTFSKAVKDLEKLFQEDTES